jgi:hypothetical protein
MRRALAIVFASALVAVVVRPAWSDEPAPSDDRAGMCDAYEGVSFTFCVAYCEARDCDVLAADDARCALLRRGFESTTGDTALPCDLAGTAAVLAAPVQPRVSGL